LLVVGRSSPRLTQAIQAGLFTRRHQPEAQARGWQRLVVISESGWNPALRARITGSWIIRARPIVGQRQQSGSV